MDFLHDTIVTQSWLHLFDNKYLVLHEKTVHEFYYNIEFSADGSINTRVGNVRIYLHEDLLGTISEVLGEGIRSVVVKTCFVEFVMDVLKFLQPDVLDSLRN